MDEYRDLADRLRKDADSYDIYGIHGDIRREAANAIEQLILEVELAVEPIYCPVCGSCGEDGCCNPKMCKGGKHCLYPDEKGLG